jgi:hypothetical protein
MAKDRISLLIPKELKEALQELATKDRRSLNAYLTLLLEEHVKKAKK